MSELKKITFIRAEAVDGGKSVINFNRPIDPEGVVAQRFVDEFKYLESISSEIEIRINSSGGSVLHGWSIIDVILESKVKTVGIITGVAASMSTLVLAACDHRYIMQHACAMVHNPFNPSAKGEESTQVKMYTSQLISFYTSRLNVSREDIVDTMLGVDGEDGTWFNAISAKKYGLVDDVIQTPSTGNKVVKFSTASYRKFASVEDKVGYLDAIAAEIDEVLSEGESLNKNRNIMLEQLCAAIGKENISADDAIVAVSEMYSKKSTLEQTVNTLSLEKDTLENTVATLIAEKEGLEGQVGTIEKEKTTLEQTVNTLSIEKGELEVKSATIQAKLDSAQASLVVKEGELNTLSAKVSEFETTQKEAEKAERLGKIEAAIADCRISAESKETWVKLMDNNPESTEAALSALEAKDTTKRLSDVINGEINPEGKDLAKKPLPSIQGALDKIESERKK